MTKDWGSQVEEEKEKGRRMQTRAKDTCNSRYYIICKNETAVKSFFIIITIIHLYKTVSQLFNCALKI